MVVNDAQIRSIHVGRVSAADENYQLYSDETIMADDYAFLKKVQDTVSAAVTEARFHQTVQQMREAAEASVNLADIPGVVKLASKDYYLNESEEAGVLGRFVEGRDMTLYGLANAVTRHSQDVESYDRASKLESIGYEIMTMSRQHWNRLNQVTGLRAAA
jgi:hypothetical protein